MTPIALIRNKWFLLAFSFLFVAALWAAFQGIYHTEVALQRLYSSESPPDPETAMRVYREMMRSQPTKQRQRSFYRLAEVLTKAGKTQEAIDVWNRLVTLRPEERDLRIRLALALHNAEEYVEAEKYFSELLEDGRK